MPGAEAVLLESDLNLIISTFEAGMVRSRDVDSPLVIFKSLIRGMSGSPESMLGITEGIPRPGRAARSDVTPAGEEGLEPPESVAAPDVDAITGAIPVTTDEPLSEESQEESSLDKLKGWLQDCVPCDFRSWGELDAEFFGELGDQWKQTLDASWDKLTQLEDMLTQSDASFVAEFCNLGNALKFQCVPDLQKILFSLGYMLSRMELDVSVDLGTLDSLLMQALNPIINEMMANIDIIDELALGPIRCVIDQMRYQAQAGPQRFQETNRQLAGMFEGSSRSTGASGGERRLEVEEAAASSAAEARERRRSDSSRRDDPGRPQSALDEVSSDLGAVSDELDLDRLTGYVQKAVSVIKDYKDWLLRVLQETIDYPLEQWNRRTSFAHGKRDILQYIALIRGIIDAAQAGDFSCGSDSETMTEEELRVFVTAYRHPSERLEVVIEGANITVRRNPPMTDLSPAGTVIRTGDGGSGQPVSVDNVILRRPIASCLKKVTTDEAAQVSEWIRQLEG